MRKILSITVAGFLFAFVIYLAISGRIVWFDFWTALAVGLCVVALGVLYWGIKPIIESTFGEKRRFHKVDPKFVHLTVVYSQRTDSPDNSIPARPRYVLNNKRNQAHRVSTWLEPYIAQHKTNWHTFEDKEALMRYLKKNNVDAHEHDPTPEDLDVVLK
jgi:cell division protein FtsW (lipid II flippase)